MMEKLEHLAGMILSEAKALGASYAQCTVTEDTTKEFNVDGGQFSLMRTLFDRGVSITMLKNQRKGAVQLNCFDDEAIRSAVRDCISACESTEPDPAWAFSEAACEKDFTSGEPVCDTDALFFRTKELLENVAQRHPKILVEQMITSHNAERSIYMNTNGVTYRTHAGAYSFSIMYSAHEGEKGSSFYSSDVTLARLDRPIIECALVERELSAVEKQIDTVPLGDKFMGTAVLAPAALMEIVLYTALGSFVSDGSLIEGTSIWKDKLNMMVADPRFTLSVTPHAPHVVVGEDYTNEGFLSEDYDIIRDGMLIRFALSQYGANKTGFERAGSSGWNLAIPAGTRSLDEIIRTIDNGILVMRFSGGQPAPSGEFSGVAKNSFRIENGKITDALSETMISGCVPDMLLHLRDISQDVLQDGTFSLPYIAFDGVTVSGQ